MSDFKRLCLTFYCVLIGTFRVQAQLEPQTPASRTAVETLTGIPLAPASPAAPVISNAPVTLAPSPHVEVLSGQLMRGGQQHNIQATFSTLQPFAGRLGFKLLSRENGSLWAEVQGGSVLFDWMWGFGLRMQYSALDFGANDHLMIGPGLGVQILPNWIYSQHWGYGGRHRHYYTYSYDEKHNSLWFMAADVDISWLHDFTPGFGFELGMKVGLAGRLSGKVGNAYPSGVMYGPNVYPIFAIYSGFRF